LEKSFKVFIMRTTKYEKISPNLPLLNGGIIPLFEKEGRGEIFRYLSIQLSGHETGVHAETLKKEKNEND